LNRDSGHFPATGGGMFFVGAVLVAAQAKQAAPLRVKYKNNSSVECSAIGNPIYLIGEYTFCLRSLK